MGEGDSGFAKIGKLFMKYLFSHIGLCFLVIAYCVGGVFLFQYLEADGERDRKAANQDVSNAIEQYRKELAFNLWKYKWSNNYEDAVAKWIEQYHTNITDAISNNGYGGAPIKDEEITYGWSFSSALLFTVTIVTTIGYGHVCPVTEAGQLTVIFYALVGVPLMLMFLANIGDAMASFFRVAYGKGCCFFCYRQRKKNYEVNKRRVEEAKRSPPKGAWNEPRNNSQTKGEFDDAGGRPGSGSLSSRPRSGRNQIRPEDGGDPLSRVEQGKGKQQQRRPSADDLDEELRKYNLADLEEPEEEVINVPISLTLVVIAAYIFIGAVLFAAWNGWTWIEGAYFSFVTLSTIGFGDYIPGWTEMGTTIGNIKLAVSSFYIVLGLAVLSMSFNLMMEEMIEKFKWLGKKLGIIDDESANKQAAADPTDQQALLNNAEPPASDTPPAGRRELDDALDGTPETIDAAKHASSTYV